MVGAVWGLLENLRLELIYAITFSDKPVDILCTIAADRELDLDLAHIESNDGKTKKHKSNFNCIILSIM